MSTQREDIAAILTKRMAGFVARIQRDYALNQADAILAAGYRKPRTITTSEEVEALAVLAVIADRNNDAYQRDLKCWRLAGYGDDFSDHEIALPATVLFEPTPGAAQ